MSFLSNIKLNLKYNWVSKKKFMLVILINSPLKFWNFLDRILNRMGGLCCVRIRLGFWLLGVWHTWVPAHTWWNSSLNELVSKVFMPTMSLKQRLDIAYNANVLHLAFFFFWLRSAFYGCPVGPCIVYRTHKPLFSTKLLLKIGLTVLFTHLKLFCYNISVFSFQ